MNKIMKQMKVHLIPGHGSGVELDKCVGECDYYLHEDPGLQGTDIAIVNLDERRQEIAKELYDWVCEQAYQAKELTWQEDAPTEQAEAMLAADPTLWQKFLAYLGLR